MTVETQQHRILRLTFDRKYGRQYKTTSVSPMLLHMQKSLMKFKFKALGPRKKVEQKEIIRLERRTIQLQINSQTCIIRIYDT